MGILLITWLALAQADTSLHGEIYEIPIKGKDRPIYGTMEERPGGWRIVEDAPWKNNPVHTLSASQVNLADRVVEVASEREARRRREAEIDGFTQVSPGVWVNSTEAALAEYALTEIAKVREQQRPAETAATPETPGTVAAANVAPPQPGFLAQWGFHAAIIVASGVLIALVVRFAILAP